jgi:broad specificity phosphatase PhoE
MRLPWHKKPEIIPDVTDLVRAGVQEEIGKLRQQVIERWQVSDTPMPGAGTQSLQQAPFPIYAFDTPIDYSTPGPPQRRPRSVVSLQTLRTVADTYDVLRSCIQHLKREVMAVPFKVVPREPGDDRRTVKAQIRQMEQFLGTTGGLGGYGRTRAAFEGMLIEDLSIIGSAAAFYSSTRGGGVYEVLPIDAATIRPSVDAFGYPGPGDDVYEQWVWGVLCGRYSPQELYFDGPPTGSRSWTPYCASPVEWLIACVNSALRADDWNRRWLTDGNTASTLYAAPESWTPEQIMAFSAYFDAIMSGDSAQRQKAKFMPSGTARLAGDSRKDADFQEFELWLLRRTCAIMGVQPASIGFAGEQYKVSQGDSMESTSAFGVGVLLAWLTTFYNDLCDRCGCPLAAVSYVTAREEKATERATRNVLLVGGGIKTINEARQDEGLDPIEGGDSPLVSTLMQTLERAITDPEPAPDDPGSDPSAPDAPPTPAQRSRALSQWEQRALKAISRYPAGEYPMVLRAELRCPPAGPILLPLDEQQAITHRLEAARSVSDVIAIFRAAQRPALYVIRHSVTADNEQNLQHGWTSDPLNGKGRKKAKKVAKWLGGRGIADLRTSDLKRAVQTAKIIGKHLSAPIIERDIAYRTWNSGDFSGRSQADVDPLLSQYAAQKPSVPVPSGESYDQFKARVLPAFQSLLDGLAAGTLDTTGVVTHSDCIKLFRQYLLAGCDPAAVDNAAAADDTTPMGGVLIVNQDGAGKWSGELVDVDNQGD